MHTATDDEQIDQLIYDTPRTAVSVPAWTSIRHPTGSPVAMSINNLMAVTQARTRQAAATYARDRSNERGHADYKVLRAQARYLGGLGWEQPRIAVELNFKPRCVVDALALAGPASKDKPENDASFVDDAFRAKYAVAPSKSPATRKDAVVQVPRTPSVEDRTLRSASTPSGTSTAITHKRIRDRAPSRSTTTPTSPTANPKRTRDHDDKAGADPHPRKKSKKAKSRKSASIPKLDLQDDVMDTEDDIPLSQMAESSCSFQTSSSRSMNLVLTSRTAQPAPSSNTREDPFSAPPNATPSPSKQDRASQKNKQKRKSEEEKRRSEKEEKQRAEKEEKQRAEKEERRRAKRKEKEEREEKKEQEERERLKRLAVMADAMVQELNSSREASESSLESTPTPAPADSRSPSPRSSPCPAQASTPQSSSSAVSPLAPPPPSLSQESDDDESSPADRRTRARARGPAPDPCPSPQSESPMPESITPHPAHRTTSTSSASSTSTTSIQPGYTTNMKIQIHTGTPAGPCLGPVAQGHSYGHGQGYGQGQGITIVVPGEIVMKGFRVTVEPVA